MGAGLVWLIAALAALLAAPRSATAQATPPPRACNDAAEPYLGITGFVCHCRFEEAPDGGRTWTFDTEMEILSVDPAGPASGILRPGDMVVAVDGQLITSGAGARRWSSLRTGEVATLRIRRDGELLEVRVPVGARCRNQSGGRQGTDAAALATDKRLLPRGWLGLGLACDCTVSAGGHYPLWTFLQLPTISRVAPGSPADHVSLRPGDILRRIDGLRLDSEAGGRAFSRIQPGSRVRFEVERAGQSLTVRLVADSLPAGGLNQLR